MFDGGDSNFYAYVGNDPTNFSDPTGLAIKALDKGCDGLGFWDHLRLAWDLLPIPLSVVGKGAMLTKDAVIEGFKLGNHAFRKGVLGRGATEEIISGAIRGAREAGTVTKEIGTGKFAGNAIEVFVHDGVKVVVDTSNEVIMSIQNLGGGFRF